MTTPAHSIKRGVSLYSYQHEYFLRTMTLEDCIAAAGEIGARGIEIIPEQSIPGFPHLTDEFVEDWFGWMDKYGTTPVCHRPLPRHQAVPGPLADPRRAGRVVPPRHRHRSAAGREDRSRHHQHAARGDGGRCAVRRGQGRPAAARGARAVPLQPPVDRAAPRGDAPHRFAGAGPDAGHGHVRQAVPARRQRAGAARRREARARRPDREDVRRPRRHARAHRHRELPQRRAGRRRARAPGDALHLDANRRRCSSTCRSSGTSRPSSTR